jgi:tripartite-type tricarboxylate transporter receptor subunit TctC
MNLKNYVAGFVVVLYLGLLGYLYLGLGLGTSFPARPITIVVHSKPGSAIDFMARKVAEIARKHSEVAFVVENRTGTQGLVAMQHVLDSKADGYTLLGVTKSFLSTVLVNKSKVNPDDFLFLADMVSDPEALIANENRGFHSLEDIVQDARQKNYTQVWMGPGTGSRDHLMAMKCWETLGIKAKWIDYKSGPQAILALMRDEAAVYVGNPADIKGKNGLNIVSISSKKRLASLPEVPTFIEQGYDLDESMWRGFSYKKGVPEEAVKFVTGILQKVVTDEEWTNYCNNSYVFSNFEGPEKFTRRVTEEMAETNLYLNKAGLLVTYVKENPLHPALIFFLIMTSVFLLLFVFIRFKIKQLNYDQIIAGGIITVSLFFLYQTFLFNIPGSVNITSPSLIPRIWIIILILLNSLLIYRSKGRPGHIETSSPGIVWAIIALLLGYLASMQWVGYYITTPVFILSVMYILNYRRFNMMAVNAFSFVLFSYIIFNQLLHIDLPLGWWFM